ncbi:MAG: hypothetical protein HYY18_06135 [Planctomycetes bacterium]|nr:hypothetical protein [Planctomycetota bacterium]
MGTRPAILAGGLFGAVAAAVAMLCVDLRVARAVPDPDADASLSPPGVSSTDGAAERARLRRELAEAQARIEQLGREPAQPEKPAAAAARPTWSSLAERFRSLARKLGRVPDEGSPGAAALGADLLDLVLELAKEKGLRPSDMFACPDGWPALVASLLQDADPPLDPTERRRLEDAVEQNRSAWEELAARRDEMGGVEWSSGVDRIGQAFTDAVTDDLSDGAWDAVDGIEGLWDANVPWPASGASVQEAHSAGELRQAWEKEWSDVLGLREEQRMHLAPILDAYLREAEEIRQEQVKRFAAARESGVSASWEDLMERRTGNMIAAQRRILEQLDLDAGQCEALKSWDRIYDFSIEKERPR